MKKLISAALLTLLAPLLVLATLLFQHGTGTAQGPVELGVDTDPNGNTATSLVTREGCVSVNAGDTFELDIFVSGVDDLVAWEFYLRFDPSIIEVADADLDMFLANNPRSSLIRKSVSYVGWHFLGAADRRLLGESGSGVLTRLTLHAKATGISHVDIPSIDFDGDGDIDKGPRLTASEGIAVGDVTGDGVFDGPTHHALIAVDESCEVATPTPTLPPSPTPQPGGGTSPAGTSPPADESTPPSDTSPPPDVLAVPGDPTFESPETWPPTDDGSASENGQDSAPGGEAEAADDSEETPEPAALAGEGTPAPSGSGGESGPAPGGDSSPASSSGGGLPLWAIGSIAAALVAAAGASVFLAARTGGRFGP